MSTLYITEYENLATDARGFLSPVPERPVAVQKVTVSAGSSQSSAFNEKTRFVELVTDTDCQWEDGSNPTADANSRFLKSGAHVFYKVRAGDKLAVITQQ